MPGLEGAAYPAQNLAPKLNRNVRGVVQEN
jgi:hypothetical protein